MGTVSDDALFDIPTSSQSRALQWIAHYDAIDPPMCPGDRLINKRIVQRYVMAVFYFATEGGSKWKQCNAPDDFNDPESVEEANDNCNIGATAFVLRNERIGVSSTYAWLSPVNECLWGGVVCWGADSSNGSMENFVDQLDFEGNGMSGTLVSELGSLSLLRFLILEKGGTEGEGGIAGTIPEDFGSLNHLVILDMDFNELTGTVPSQIYGLSSLQQLDLNDNHLSGTIATEIGQLSSLMFFQIDHNNFSGSIPTEMGLLHRLRIGLLSFNEFDGTMPADVCANRNNTSPPGRLGILVADCSKDMPEIICDCCSACEP